MCLLEIVNDIELMLKLVNSTSSVKRIFNRESGRIVKINQETCHLII